ncbi:hypothetical protein ABTL76_19865, partial [Acinetobacter baumannii]
IATMDHALDRNLTNASTEVRKIGDMARRGFVMPAMPAGAPQPVQEAARAAIANAFLDTIRRVMMLTAALSLASAAAAALTIKP